MRALFEQTLAEGRVRERRSRAISRVFDIALPVLIVLCLLLWRERYNVIISSNVYVCLLAAGHGRLRAVMRKKRVVQAGKCYRLGASVFLI